MSRLGLKTGVILLGTLYSLAELAHLGRLLLQLSFTRYGQSAG
ncbi:MAG: hypothetical protein PVI97_09220 [Candidatus Thiodiazotropha sp.]